MARHLLDTYTCIYWLKDRGGVRNRVDKHGGLKAMTVAAITVAELYVGAYFMRRSNPKGNDFSNLVTFLGRVNIIPYDSASAQRFGAVRSGIDDYDVRDNFDLSNACIALTSGYTLVTGNMKDYKRVRSLKAVTWITRP